MHRDTEHVHATFCGGKEVDSIVYVRQLKEASATASGVDPLISTVDEPELLRPCSY
jgi:hypothetical protein